MDGAERLAQILLFPLRLIAHRFDKEIEIFQPPEKSPQDRHTQPSPEGATDENQSEKSRQRKKARQGKSCEQGETTAWSAAQSCSQYSASGPTRPWSPTR